MHQVLIHLCPQDLVVPCNRSGCQNGAIGAVRLMKATRMIAVLSTSMVSGLVYMQSPDHATKTFSLVAPHDLVAMASIGLMNKISTDRTW